MRLITLISILFLFLFLIPSNRVECVSRSGLKIDKSSVFNWFKNNVGSKFSKKTFEANATTLNFDGEVWAVLVAGSNGYDNYRHQADVCHAYQVLRNNGVPENRIIVMMYDDIAHNTDNPFKGELINEPNGMNVYVGVPKDYTAADVNPEMFLRILQGI